MHLFDDLSGFFFGGGGSNIFISIPAVWTKFLFTDSRHVSKVEIPQKVRDHKLDWNMQEILFWSFRSPTLKKDYSK